MSDYAVMPSSDYKDVCNAVREMTGETAVIKSGVMADKVSAVYEKGQQKALIDMWEALQGGGMRSSYGSGFFAETNFTKRTFKPIYDIKPTGTNTYQWGKSCPLNKEFLLTEGQVNMKELEQEQGMVFDFSECTNFTQTFCGGLFSELNVIDISKATNTLYAFYGGYLNGGYEVLRLKRIEKLICSENTVFDDTTFRYAEALYYIGFEGVIAKSINLGDCPLIAESIQSCVNTLSDTATDKTVTFKLSAVNTAFETAEGLADGSESQEWLNLIATKENWTFSLV